MLKELMDIIKEWVENRKTGSITVNFFKGGIANVMKNESVKLSESTTKKGGRIYGTGESKA